MIQMKTVLNVTTNLYSKVYIRCFPGNLDTGTSLFHLQAKTTYFNQSC